MARPAKPCLIADKHHRIANVLRSMLRTPGTHRQLRRPSIATHFTDWKVSVCRSIELLEPSPMMSSDNSPVHDAGVGGVNGHQALSQRGSSEPITSLKDIGQSVNEQTSPHPVECGFSLLHPSHQQWLTYHPII